MTTHSSSVPPSGWPLTTLLAIRKRCRPGTGSSAGRRQPTRSSISSLALMPEAAATTMIAAVRTIPTRATAWERCSGKVHGSVLRPSAAEVPAADGRSTLPWTLPLHRSQAVALVGIVRTAAIIVVAAASGMRASELMELRVGCRRPAEEPVPGLQRFRIASKVVKGQPLGGTDDEWVVIEPVYRAVELAEQLHDDPRDGAL